MCDEYQKRVHKHYRIVMECEHALLEIAQRVCPGGHWLLQVEARREHGQAVYHVVAHNGDDNVTGTGRTFGAAIAKLIHHLLNGSVFPLGGNNGGRFNRDVWEKDIEEAENAARSEGMKAAAKMAYEAGKGATREADACLCEMLARSVELEIDNGSIEEQFAQVEAATFERAARAIRNQDL